MITVVLLIVISLMFSYNGYLVWYAKSGRYSEDQRFDAYTKRS